MHPTASVSLVVAFCVVVAAVVVAAVASVGAVHARWRVRAVVAVCVWLAATAAVGFSGVMLDVSARPPPFAVVVAVTFGTAVVVGVSAVGAGLARLPLWWLVGFHAFRLPLEIVMHAAADAGVMPQVMSWDGRNFDVVAGVAAIVVAVALRRGAPRWVAGAWLAFATVTLINVVVVAVRASPLLRHFGDDEVNVWVAYAPFIWLPTVLVASAVAGHIVLLRALLRPRDADLHQ